MTYKEVLKLVIGQNGGFAPLNHKDKNTIQGKTPNATIRETLQRNEDFFP